MLVTDRSVSRLPGLDIPPFQLSGTVISALLNHRPQLEALGDAVHAAPYKAPPRAPVLAVRPRHMLSVDGDAIPVPAPVEVGVSLGVVIGRAACALDEERALQAVAGYLIVGELRVPLDSHYRPGVRHTSRDGFCPIGPRVVPAAAVADPLALAARVSIDGQPAQQTDTGQRVRGVAQLLADVTGFMTLQPGDVLTLGISHGAPLAGAGQAVGLEIEGLGRLSFRLIAEAA